jgi:hypothetical protein
MSIVSEMANKIVYSSFDRLVGLLPSLYLFINTICFFVDIGRLLSHYYIKNVLVSHTRFKIEKVLLNQQTLLKLKLREDTFDNDLRDLRLRNKILKFLRRLMMNLKFLVFASYFIYLSLIAIQFLIAIVLHIQSNHIITYQLPQTLLKIIREYEKQQIELLNSGDNLVYSKMENVVTGSREENLVNSIHIYFKCCNYQNPFRFGDLAPETCNYNRGCLNPMQDFLWTYVYISVILILFLASVKFLIEAVLALNFGIILIKRLINRVYYAEAERIVLVGEQVNLLDDDENEQDQEFRQEQAKKKLLEIRRKKECLLEREEIEEEKMKTREEIEMDRFLKQDKAQQAYEKMLLEQNRFEELQQEQFKRQLQAQFLIIQNET